MRAKAMLPAITADLEDTRDGVKPLATLLMRIINYLPTAEVLPERRSNWAYRPQNFQTAAPRQKVLSYSALVSDVTRPCLIRIEQSLRERTGLPPPIRAAIGESPSSGVVSGGTPGQLGGLFFGCRKMPSMNMELADIPMLTETELREQYASLQQRALQLGSHGQTRIDRLAAATQTPPNDHADEYVRVVKGATDDAMVAVLSYHRAVPFRETANSLIESLAQPAPPTDEDGEWHEQILFRLAEVLEMAAELIAEGEGHLERSNVVSI